jgi:two-component system sensor histidine kinase and response regulator WspE
MSSGDEFSLLDLFHEEVRVHTATLSQGLLELEKDPTNPQRIEPLMRAAHSIKGAARIVNIEPAVQLAHVLEDVFVAAQEGRIRIGPEHVDLFLKGTDVLAGLVHVHEENVKQWAASQAAAIAGLREQLRQVAQGQEPVPALPPVVKAVARASVPAPQPIVPSDVGAPALPAPAALEAPGAPAEPVAAVVRVTAQSLNRLMGLAGESLVHARWLSPFSTALLRLKKLQDHLAGQLDSLAQLLSARASADQIERLIADARRQSNQCRQVLAEQISEFEDHAGLAEDLNSRLYQEVIVSRMRPFSDGAHGFPRLVRDLARRLNKQVELEIVGQNTEVDRDILEKLEAPLTHLLRNAVDHGVESPEVRQAAGKPAAGLVRLDVRHRAGMLAITLTDDGAGIDLERLRQKVIERGLTTAEMAQSLREAELLEFLFLPGFSTAPAVTEVSGRGVGLDVVHELVRTVGGSVHIKTRLGQGTTFSLQLPLTLSVLRAVLVDIAGEPYAFPHNRIDRLLRVPRSGLQSLENRQFVSVDGRSVGIVLASQLFDLPTEAPEANELPVLLVSDASGEYGLIVEGFRGEQDLVVRRLDPRLGKVPNVSAAAILDDGSPVLIVDVEDLIRSMDRFIQTGSLFRCEEQPAALSRKKRILVVDDSITVREAERHLLQNQGYVVTAAVDGREAWNLVREQPFDLVVTDVDMPRMNGLELVRAMRNEEHLKQLPVIIVSYKEQEEDRLRGLEVGANYYLTKSSFHDNTFLQAVLDLIGEPEAS